MQRRILITGATGTVGGSVLSELVGMGTALNDRGFGLRVGVRDLEAAKRLDTKDAEVVFADFSKAESLKAAFDSVDTLFVLFPPSLDIVDLAGTTFSIAKSAGIKYVVKICEWDIDNLAKRLKLYAFEQQVERLLAESGIPCVRIHPTNYMQNFYKFYGASYSIPRSSSFRMALGDGRTTFVDTRDVASVAVKALLDPSHAGSSWKLTGVSVTMHDVASSFSRVLGRKISYDPLTLEEAASSWAQLGLPDWVIEVLVVVNEVQRGSAYAGLYPDLERLLGRPARTFDEFVRDNASMFQAT